MYRINVGARDDTMYFDESVDLVAVNTLVRQLIYKSRIFIEHFVERIWHVGRTPETRILPQVVRRHNQKFNFQRMIRRQQLGGKLS
jgi:hypothetical protein